MAVFASEPRVQARQTFPIPPAQWGATICTDELDIRATGHGLIVPIMADRFRSLTRSLGALYYYCTSELVHELLQ